MDGGESVQASTPSVSWSDIDRAPPETRQARLIEAYFQLVRPNVIAEVENLATNIPEASTSRTSGSNTAADNGDNDGGGGENGGGGGDGDDDSNNGDDNSSNGNDRNDESQEDVTPLWERDDISSEDIWCTLVFRSICWLMLHDFHRNDVQIPKSELFGSRLQVYIA